MDAETWGGEAVVVSCPQCSERLYKARTLYRTDLWCGCRGLQVTSENHSIYITQHFTPSAGSDVLNVTRRLE